MKICDPPNRPSTSILGKALDGGWKYDVLIGKTFKKIKYLRKENIPV